MLPLDKYRGGTVLFSQGPSELGFYEVFIFSLQFITLLYLLIPKYLLQIVSSLHCCESVELQFKLQS